MRVAVEREMEQCQRRVVTLLRAGLRSALGHALAERSGASGMRPIGVVAYREARIPACRAAGACVPPCVLCCRGLHARACRSRGACGLERAGLEELARFSVPGCRGLRASALPTCRAQGWTRLKAMTEIPVRQRAG